MEIDLSTCDPQLGFTEMELAKAIGPKSFSPIVNTVRKGQFTTWTKDKDPDSHPWYCTGEGKQRRFFQEEKN